MSMEKRRWLRLALQVKGSVIPAVLPRSLFCGFFALIVKLLLDAHYPVSLPLLASLIPNIVLGLLLVFRTNTAYDRFWEGRKFWGSIVNTVRNLARQIWLAVEEKEAGDRPEKVKALYLLVAFAIATKLHLRQEPIDPEIKDFLSPGKYKKLQRMNNPPLKVAFWIGDYLQSQYQHNRLNIYQSDTPSEAGGLMNVTAPRAGVLN